VEQVPTALDCNKNPGDLVTSLEGLKLKAAQGNIDQLGLNEN